MRDEEIPAQNFTQLFKDRFLSKKWPTLIMGAISAVGGVGVGAAIIPPNHGIAKTGALAVFFSLLFYLLLRGIGSLFGVCIVRTSEYRSNHKGAQPPDHSIPLLSTPPAAVTVRYQTQAAHKLPLRTTLAPGQSSLNTDYQSLRANV
jgi:hypothetical protein